MTHGEVPLESDKKFSSFITIFFLYFTFQVILYIPIFTFVKMGLISTIKHPIQLLLEKDGTGTNLLLLILTVGIIYPIIEELGFRYSLFFTKMNKIATGLSFILALIIVKNLSLIGYLELDLHWDSTALEFLTYTLILIPIVRKLSSLVYMDAVYKYTKTKKFIRLSVFISSALFAVHHIGVADSADYYILYIIILLPYFISGYVFSLIRCWFGLHYSIVFHGAYNTILLLLSWSLI